MKTHICRFTSAGLLAIFLSAGWLFITVPSAATLQNLQVGYEAPDFSAKNLQGETKSFAAMKGEKLTVLLFWASWSPKSEKALSRMETLYQKYKDQGLSVVGINVEGQQINEEALRNIKGMAERLKITYPILIDYGLATFHEYGVIAVPTTVILDGRKTIKYELSSYPLVGFEEMIDFVGAAIEGRRPSDKVAQKIGYQPDKKALRFLNMGDNSLKSKRMADSAEDWYKKAIDADPGFVAPHLSLGKYYMKREKLPLAKEQFEQALAKEATNVIALCELGMLLINDGKINEGKALFDKALKIEEAYTPCHYYLGFAYGKEGKEEEALKMFDNAMKINPMDYRIYVYKARVFEQNKKLREAAESYKKALELVSNRKS